ncbi:MAG TPA: SDR family oxidoreductase [Terricaulis sp.]|nr:SDR family oxidoreductase [Terricaulis sp.]
MRVIITGAASGIGRALAEELAEKEKPAALLLVGRNRAKLEELANTLPNAHVCAEDLTDPAAAQRVVASAQSKLGGIDAVVSNAGAIYAGALATLSAEDFDKAFAINVRATFLLAQAAYPALKQSKGVLIASGSLAGRNPSPNLGAYSASKAALAMLIAQLAAEWGPDGIRCNCVSPGTTVTAMNAAFYADPKNRAARAANIPLRRLGDPRDIARVIHFLLRPDAGFVSGVDLLVDGGANTMFMPLYLQGATPSEG